MFAEYPSQIADLQPPLFNTLIQLLQHGLNQYPFFFFSTYFIFNSLTFEFTTDGEVSLRSVEALVAITHFNLKLKQKKSIFGLQKQLEANPQLIPELLKFVMTFLLFHDFDVDLLSHLSELFFYLLCTDQNAYQSLVNELFIRFEGTNKKERVVEAFSQLFRENGGVALSLDRTNLLKFEKNLKNILASIKGFLITK